jgi:hypothetical protein
MHLYNELIWQVNDGQNMSVIICGFVKLLFILYVKIYLSPGLEITQELQA